MRQINPFVPDPGRTPPVLAGREKELSGFLRALEADRPLALVGLRGTGKTVLLREFAALAEEKRWLTLRIELNARHSLESGLTDLLSYHIEARAAVLTARYPRTTRFVKKTGAGPRRAKVGPAPGREGLMRGLAELIELARAAGLGGVVLLLDEFQSLRHDPNLGHYGLATLLEAVTAVRQDRLPCHLVVAGLPALRRNLTEAKTYAERMFSFVSIGHLSEDATREAIVRPLESGRMRFSSALVERLVHDTHGYAYFVQFFPFFIIQNASLAAWEPVTVLDLPEYDALKSPLLDELDEQFYRFRFERGSEDEVELLLGAATFGEEFALLNLIERSGKDRNRVNQMLLDLLDKEILVRLSRGHYGYALPLFHEFLRREAQRREPRRHR